MKKAVLIILSLAVIWSMAVSQAWAVEDSIESRILEEWKNYLGAFDNYWQDYLWAVDYADRYVNSPDWDGLQEARMVLEGAELYGNSIYLSESEVSPEEIDSLIRKGEDLDFVLPRLNGFEELKASNLASYQMLRQGLMHYAFSRGELEAFRKILDNKRTSVEYEFRFAALETAYLLSEINSPDLVQGMRDYIEDVFPYIYEYMPEPESTSEDIFIMTQNAYDEYEEFNTDCMDALGEMSSAIYDISDWITEEDFESLGEEAVSIAGLPITLPMPEWLYSEAEQSYYYSYQDTEGNLSDISEREEIWRAPDKGMIKTAGISKDEALSYIDLLRDLGCEFNYKDETEDVFTFYYTLGEHTFAIKWTEDITTFYMLENPVCLAPEWYVYVQMF